MSFSQTRRTCASKKLKGVMCLLYLVVGCAYICMSIVLCLALSVLAESSATGGVSHKKLNSFSPFYFGCKILLRLWINCIYIDLIALKTHAIENALTPKVYSFVCCFVNVILVNNCLNCDL